MIPKIAAHRGLTSKFQENTIDAIIGAQNIGADMIEFDVMRTSDEVWILHHDRFIDDPENRIENLRFEEVLEHKESIGEELDILDDLVPKIGNVHLNYELKSDKYEIGAKFADKIDELDPKHPFNISSFSRQALFGVHHKNPELKLSYLGYILPFFKWGLLNRQIPLVSINPYIKFIGQLKRSITRKMALEIHTWTANSPEDIMNCFKLGIDVIISDFPERCLQMRKEYFNIKSKHNDFPQ